MQRVIEEERCQNKDGGNNNGKQNSLKKEGDQPLTWRVFMLSEFQKSVFMFLLPLS